MLDSLNCLSQSACCWRNVQGLWGGVWSLEFGVWRRCRCFLAFCRAGGGVQKWPVGGKSIACPRVECFFPTPKRSQAPCPRDFQAWASCTNRQRLDPRAQNQNHPRNQLPAADWRSSPIPQRRTPTAPHTTDNFPFVFIPPPPPKTKSRGRPPNMRRIWATHLPLPRRPSLSGGTACMYNWTGATWAQALSRRAGTASRTEKGTPAVCRPSP